MWVSSPLNRYGAKWAIRDTMGKQRCRSRKPGERSYPLLLWLRSLSIKNNQTLSSLGFSPQMRVPSPPQHLLQCLHEAVWICWLGNSHILLEEASNIPPVKAFAASMWYTAVLCKIGVNGTNQILLSLHPPRTDVMQLLTSDSLTRHSWAVEWQGDCGDGVASRI